jgi:hypothetical protein
MKPGLGLEGPPRSGEPGLAPETIATLSGILASPREERSLPWQQPLKLVVVEFIADNGGADW